MKPEKLSREMLAKRIAGEVVLSDSPGKTLQKWRNIFKISQKELAEKLGVMPSVISDYEGGRRKSPGIKVIKKIVETMISIDEERGGHVIKSFSSFPTEVVLSDVVIDLKEFEKPISIENFCSILNAELVAKKDFRKTEIYGYTIIDSLKAIIELPPLEMVKLYGLTSQRALIFTGVKRGRSPMVAIKVTNLKPGLVVYQGEIEKVDEIAIRIAETENIPLAIVKTLNVNEIIERLDKIK